MDLKNKRYFPLLLQMTRFGVVGVLAACVHFCMVVLLVETQGWAPLVANIFAFVVAFQVSYWGHRSWTFSGTLQKHSTAFSRLLLVSLSAFIGNETLFYIFMKQLGFSYPVALVLVLSITPVFVFTANKFWVFE